MNKESPEVKSVKFLIKELIATLDMLEAKDYDEELAELLTKLSRRLV